MVRVEKYHVGSPIFKTNFPLSRSCTAVLRSFFFAPELQWQALHPFHYRQANMANFQVADTLSISGKVILCLVGRDYPNLVFSKYLLFIVNSILSR